MKKKDQITIHKNLQSGKIQVNQSKNSAAHPISQRAITDKNSQRPHRKILSQQKVNIQKPSQSKNSNKQSKPITSSINKNEKSKSKTKGDSVKGSKKTLKRHHSQDQNSITSARRKNIYTDGKLDKKNKSKKKSKYTDQSSEAQNNEHNEQNSMASMSQSVKSESQRLQVQHLVQQISQNEFSNLHKLKLHVLNFIFKNRIIRDQQYDRLYELMIDKFPDREETFKSILFQIVSSLDN